MRELMPVNTVDEVAAYLKVSPTTVYRLVSRRELKSIKALGKTRITKEAVLELIHQ